MPRRRWQAYAPGFAVQLGGAAGTLAASTELARLRGLPEPAQVSWRLVESVASALGLVPSVPWHTSRTVITAAGDAFVGCTDAYGRIAADVATLSRPEIAELAEGSGGGSSTMPQKHNPVLSVLIRRSALTGPPLASTLHLAAATNVDERPDGSWHAEWATLRDLARRTVVAASQASELITGLVVDEDRMAANLAAAAGIEAEQQAMADLVPAERSEESSGRCRAEQGVSGRHGAHHRPGFGSGWSAVWSGLMSVPRISGVQLSDPSAGPLLLLGTSIGTSATALWSASAALLGERFHVVAWDLPGHGRNTEPVSAGFTMAELASGVLALADQVLTDRGEPGGRLYYAGDSLGGAVGLQALLDAPDRILAAVLLCTGAKIGDAEGWRERAARVRASGTTVVVNQSVERWFAPGFLEREPQVGGRLLESLRAADAEAYALACEALADFDVRPRLAEIAVPVLAVAGAEDFATQADLLREIADGVQRGALQILDGVAHLAPAEAPQEVAKLIMKHLDADAGGVRGGSPPRDQHSPGADRYAAGMQVRRQVLGDAHVDRATSATTDFTRDFQQLITEYAWGSIWTRPGLDRRSRSMITLTALVARGHHEELAMHVRAARRNGLSVDEIKEVLLQTAIYCGVPDANTAFRIAQAVLADEETTPEEDDR